MTPLALWPEEGLPLPQTPGAEPSKVKPPDADPSLWGQIGVRLAAKDDFEKPGRWQD